MATAMAVATATAMLTAGGETTMAAMATVKMAVIAATL